MFPLRVSATTLNGTDLGWVHLPNETDAAKVHAIRASLIEGEEFRRPVVLVDAGDHHIALSGSHRLTAAVEIDGVIDAIILSSLTEDQVTLLLDANDDHDRLAALIEVAEDTDEEIDGLEAAITAIRGEIAANDRGE
ncbi:hypothetical protein SAMN02745172_02437 [Pseudoxanthobacter soli DSM 19599]|uniref:ParB-like nuclease domain-containing protein n=2 Tax=Pseudoxanthobacter TaxID=433838 RepID=A0A1M7ZLL2_9HYPH|nr:hypothetical protein SAMN02745172_02437 [Pseudoxanthobacter soli DSM 19599]